MIYTVTFNPALDYAVQMEQMVPGNVNRTKKEQISFGGKGINVSVVLKHLGVESKALGFIAGFTGKEIERRVKAEGVSTDFITLSEGMSRINVKIKAEKETEINGQGPDITENAKNQLFEQLNLLSDGDVLVLAGSVPATLPPDIYEQIMKQLQNQSVFVVVDATRTLLLNVLKYHPFLIKPNNHELGELFGVTCKTKEEIAFYAKKLQEKGAKNVLVSMAGDGAVFLSEQGKVFFVAAPEPDGTVINSVGAGDSMVAGFLASYFSEYDYEKAVKYGAAAGSATAFSEGLAEKSQVEALFHTMGD